MKYFITGLHSSGKQEVLDILSSQNIRCGKLFSNIEAPSTDIYNSFNYELFTNIDINDIFENNAYVFIQELQNTSSVGAYKYFEGMSTYSLDNNDVFALSPDQVLSISLSSISNEEICFVLLDNTKNDRKTRHHAEKRMYNFNDRDIIEKDGIQSFVKFIYGLKNAHVLYFSNEDPGRVASIIYSLIKHPDLFNIYAKYFN